MAPSTHVWLLEQATPQDPEALPDWMRARLTDPLVLPLPFAWLRALVALLLINIFLLIVGAVIDTASAILLLTPLLVPIVKALGIDPVHFGIIMTVNLSIGMFTPPFGLNIFVAQAVFGTELRTIYAGIAPYIAISILVLFIITYVPGLSLWLTQL